MLVMMDHQVYPEFQVKWELGVFLVPEDLLACLGHQAFLEQKAVKELRATRVRQDLLGHLVKLVAKVLLVLRDQLDLWDHQDKLDQEANLDCLDFLAQMVWLEILGHLVYLVQKATLAPKDMLALLVFLDQEESREIKEKGESLESLAKKESEAMKASKVTWARKVTEV